MSDSEQHTAKRFKGPSSGAMRYLQPCIAMVERGQDHLFTTEAYSDAHREIIKVDLVIRGLAAVAQVYEEAPQPAGSMAARRGTVVLEVMERILKQEDLSWRQMLAWIDDVECAQTFQNHLLGALHFMRAEHRLWVPADTKGLALYDLAVRSLELIDADDLDGAKAAAAIAHMPVCPVADAIMKAWAGNHGAEEDALVQKAVEDTERERRILAYMAKGASDEPAQSPRSLRAWAEEKDAIDDIYLRKVPLATVMARLALEPVESKLTREERVVRRVRNSWSLGPRSAEEIEKWAEAQDDADQLWTALRAKRDTAI